MSMTYLGTATGTGSSPIIEFTNIPAGYTDLKIKYLLRSTNGSFYADGNTFTVNGSPSGYSWTRLWNVASSGGSSSSMSFGLTNANNTTANTLTIGEMDIANYRAARPKAFSFDTSTETNTSTDGYYMMVYSGLWSGTDPITSIRFNSGAGNFTSTSQIWIYGITAGSSGGVVVS